MKKRGNSFLYIGGGITAAMVALILVGFFWTPYNTTEMNAAAKFQAPSLQHLLGTDNFGRDIFSRVLEGAGTTFLIGICENIIKGLPGMTVFSDAFTFALLIVVLVAKPTGLFGEKATDKV